jgi:peptidoglycan-associated lipoprotein
MNNPLRMAQAALTALTALLLAVAGCSTTTSLDEPTVESRTPVPVGGAASGAAGSGAQSAGTEQSRVATVDLSKAQRDAAAAALAQRVVYFDYDSYVIKDEFRPMLEAHAKALTANRSQGMVIEGHTDETGGSEYNLALGQKRAESVLKALVLLGVGNNQLEAVSFGKERPVETGTDEAALAKTRRAVLKNK